MTPEQIILTFMAARGTLRDRLLAAVAAAYDRHAGASTEEADQWLAAVVPLVLGAQAAMATLTNSYLSRLLTVQLDRQVRPVVLNPQEIRGAGVRGGVSPQIVYDRSIRDIRIALSEQRPFDEGFRAGRSRALDAADTDLALSHRAASRVVLLPQDEVIGSRRILTPPSCQVCVADAQTIYPKGKREVRLHVRCDCTIASVTRSHDPGVLNEGRDAGGVVAEEHEHDELGPIITDSRYHFTERTRLGQLA